MTASSTTSPSRPEPRPGHLAGPEPRPGRLAERDVRPRVPPQSRAGRSRVAVIACGALAQHVSQIAERSGWRVDVHPLPPLLHNHPGRIAGQVAALATDLAPRYATIAVGYADCGTYGALDEVCDRLGIRRLPGAHCYDLYAGAERLRALFEAEPGTYVLTDFLVRSFRRTILAELGLDRYPELREDYFGHYRRVVWLAQHPTPELRREAASAAAALGLPLETVTTATMLLEEALSDLVGATSSLVSAAPAAALAQPAGG